MFSLLWLGLVEVEVDMPGDQTSGENKEERKQTKMIQIWQTQEH